MSKSSGGTGRGKAGTGSNSKEKDIDSYESFEKTANKAFDKLDQSKSNLVPIYKLRRELGEGVNRKDFDNWLGKMQADKKILLQGGDMDGITPEKAKDSYETSLGELRYYATRLGAKKKK